MSGTLYVVATPIGNLADLSERALKTLKHVELIACEDTRHTKKLLQHFGISTKTVSYHEHNEKERSRELIEMLEAGRNIAIVSDAGTPLISDPGYRVVASAIDKEIAVVPIPGPSALIAALSVSGLPTDGFFFAGFLPSRSGERQARLKEIRSIPGTLIFYEAPHRLSTTLKEAREILGERQAVVARELTKLHEEIKHGRLSDLAEYYSNAEAVRGEIVVLIDRNVLTEEDGSRSQVVSVSQLVADYEAQGFDHRTALKKAARELGLSRAEAYRKLMTERSRT